MQTHVIPDRTVSDQVKRIESGLRKEGIDPTGLPLDDVAGELVRRALVDRLTEAGAHVVGSTWGRGSSGRVEVHVELPTAADEVVFRAVTTDDEWA